jgi:hypothetical protein
MDLLKEIREKAKRYDRETLLKAMGYQSSRRAGERLESLLLEPTLVSWLSHPHYDLHYSSRDFIYTLCSVLKIDRDACRISLEKAERDLAEIRELQQAYLFVNTNFRRTTEPIFVLALVEHLRRLKIGDAESLLYQNTEQIIDKVGEQIRKHYDENEGKIAPWGEIISYTLNLKDRRYLFNPQGELLTENDIPCESKATLTIKHKPLM